jgi:hypothetical protein
LIILKRISLNGVQKLNSSNASEIPSVTGGYEADKYTGLEGLERYAAGDGYW